MSGPNGEGLPQFPEWLPESERKWLMGPANPGTGEPHAPVEMALWLQRNTEDYERLLTLVTHMNLKSGHVMSALTEEGQATQGRELATMWREFEKILERLHII